MAHTTPRVEQGILLSPLARGNVVAVGSPQWFSWLSSEENVSFFFKDEAGSFTARKERRQRGGRYWIAYRSRGGKLAKTYMGRGEELTHERLSEIASLLAAQGRESVRAVQAAPVVPRLLVGKFAPPPLTGRTAHILERPQLLARLDESWRFRLTLVTAPAGSGKTTLLSNWYAMNHTPQSRHGQTPQVAWISLDERDDEPLRFWSCFWHALDNGEDGTAEALTIAMPLYSTPQMSPETMLATLVSRLSREKRPRMLILDDYSSLHCPQIHEGMAFLLTHLPAHIHLILAGRNEPELPLGRARLYGDLLELRAADLRLQADEIERFFVTTIGVTLSTEMRRELEVRTEGWLAGLGLAAMALRGHAEPLDALEAVSGSQRAFFAYFAEEVLQQQPEEIQRFLLATAPLTLLTPQLCAAVLAEDGQSSDGAGVHLLLESVERANLFLIPLDEQRASYRYHTLFREFLLTRLRQSLPGQESLVLQRAAAWYEQQGTTEEAIEYLLMAQHYVQAQRLIQQIGEEIVWRKGEVGRLLSWVQALPSSLVTAHGQLTTLYAWALLLSGQLERSEALLESIEGRMGEEEGTLRGDGAALRARIAAFRGERTRVIELSRLALRTLPRERALLRADVAFGMGGCGDLDESYRMLAEALHISQALGSLRTMLFASRYLADVCLQQGRLTEAEAILHQALVSSRTSGKQQAPATGIIYIGWAEVLYERNELDMALRHAQTGIELGERSGEIKALLSGFCVLARIYTARGEFAHAQQEVSQAEALARMGNVPWLREQMAAIAVQLALLQDDIAGAIRAARTSGIDPEQASGLERDDERLLLARIWLAQEKWDQAIALLEALLDHARAANHMRFMVHALSYLALALTGAGRQRQAVQYGSEALLLAEPEGYIRGFLDAGPAMRNVLQRVRGSAARYARKILSIMGETAEEADAPLSEREREVLLLLADGMSNQEIAETLVIAASTVKAHVTHLCQKLGVQNRLQAVAQARTRGLL